MADAPIRLRGMTWDHARGYDPLVACSAWWREMTGVEIAWDRRSLQDFESYPVEDLARRYDLIVIDHPHVGQIVGEHCLEPLDTPDRAGELAALARGSLGGSFESYAMGGRQWALPIDAAAQVQAWRPDLIAWPAATWAEVVALAAEGRVACPLRPPHSLMSLYTLCGQLGASGRVEGPDLFDPVVGATAYRLLADLAAALGPDAYDCDPIAVLEAMARPESAIACAPLIYGYVSYAMDAFRPARLAFADIPLAGGVKAPVGSALGGTGVAVSAYSEHKQAAANFAFQVAGGEVQRGLYARSGGQPGHADAWADAAVNAATHGFYADTRATLDGAWLRPRHDGYMGFQAQASDRLNQGLNSGEAGESVIAALNALYRATLK